MATLHERYEKTKQYILDEEVTPLEAVVHLYLWTRFEFAIIRRNKAALDAQKYARKLNENLDVFNMRKEMSEYGL